MKIYTGKTRAICVLTTLAAAESLMLVGVPYFSSRFINAIVDRQAVVLNFILLASCMLAVLIINIVKKCCAVKIAREEELCVQHELLEKFQNLNPGYVEHFANGEIGMKFLRDAQIYSSFFRELYPQFIGSVCVAGIALISVLLHSRLIAVLFFLFMLIMGLTLLPFRKKFARNNNAIRRIYDRSINKVFEFIHIYPFLKSMAAHTPFADLPYTRFTKFRQINIFNDFTNIRFELYNRLILFSGEICILGSAGYFAWQKIITVGEVVFFQVLFLSVFSAFSSLFQLLPMYESIKEAIRSIEELQKYDLVEDCRTGKEFTGITGDIIAEKLSFHYPDSERMIFEDFTCRISPGSIVAVTGANGQGKTTLFKLLTGYLEPTAGKILIGNDDLRDVNKVSFRSKIAYVFQDSLLITGTLQDNITLKNPRYTKCDIVRALALSGAECTAVRMPEGLNHKIGFDGGDLSGGERQKIAIARALIRQPEILIFDEVTNHLDYTSRLKMRDLIVSLRGKVTVLMVSHDPELTALCDQEINLHCNGEIKNA